MPTIKLTNSRYFTKPRPGCIGTHPRHVWPIADFDTNMRRGFNIDRTDDPPPRPPNLDIILLTGNYEDACSLGQQLAEDLGNGFLHVDIGVWLKTIHAMPDGEQKKEALGMLHPLTFHRVMRREVRSLSSKVLIEQVLLRRITQLVGKGMRRFVVTGFAEVVQIPLFRDIIAVPQAVVWIQQPQVSNSQPVREWLKWEFGLQKCIFMPRAGVTKLGELYARLLRALGEKAGMEPQLSKKEEKDGDPSPRNGMAAMLAKAALDGEGMATDSPRASNADEDMLMAGIEDFADEEKHDTPLEQDQFDEAMDLLAGLEEYANGSMGE